MRGMMLMMTLAVVGCASQPSTPQANASPVAAPPGTSVEGQRLIAAKNLNLKIVDKDGQQLFCRSSQMTATRIQRDPTCFTADQLDHMQAQMERDMEQLTTRPAQGQGLPSH